MNDSEQPSILERTLGFVLGRRLANSEGQGEKIGFLSGLAALDLDGLSSAAYGPEAAMAILLPIGALSLSLVFPVMLAVIGLLLVLYLSYWQIITAYPSNGGAYTVASENLGQQFGLLAATALMLDYTLNVAVGISAGIGALTSALPVLAPHTLLLCLAVLVLVTLVNLRGAADAGAVFVIPTYVFVVGWIVILSLGLWFVASTGGHPHPVIRPPKVVLMHGQLGVWILFAAFANGCTAMTGVEAVSNGVSAFKEPTVKNAHRTLSGIVVLLAILLGGIAYLVKFYGIYAMDQNKPGYQSVLSQLAQAIVGHGFFYYVAIASTLAVLSLAANTSFNGFPRLCRQLARDRFLPKGFELPGRRLVYTVGILFLALAAGGLLVLFNGITDALIPLFAIGAFTAFILSQAGIAVYWWRQRHAEGRGWVYRLIINGFGATLTTVALAIIIVTKFISGAWITLVAIPLLFAILWKIKTYYTTIERKIASGPLQFRYQSSPIVLVIFQNWDELTAKALKFAMRLSGDITAVRLTALEGPDGDENESQLRDEWRINVEVPAGQVGFKIPRLLLIKSQYRQFLEPLVQLVQKIENDEPERTVAILIPEMVMLHWWDYLLQSYRTRNLRAALFREGSSRTVIIDVPWHVGQGRSN
ncbi:APC family permease [Acidiphilium sp.]|uniref:APC family permease n=1 Tax=Acidiphilium sp. TaxID=527 RepID=UPI003CFDE351